MLSEQGKFPRIDLTRRTEGETTPIYSYYGDSFLLLPWNLLSPVTPDVTSRLEELDHFFPWKKAPERFVSLFTSDPEVIETPTTKQIEPFMNSPFHNTEAEKIIAHMAGVCAVSEKWSPSSYLIHSQFWRQNVKEAYRLLQREWITILRGENQEDRLIVPQKPLVGFISIRLRIPPTYDEDVSFKPRGLLQ